MRTLYSKTLKDSANQEEIRMYVELSGTSLETKPTDDMYVTGSKFEEVDTGTIYSYDEGTKVWYVLAEMGGGS